MEVLFAEVTTHISVLLYFSLEFCVLYEVHVPDIVEYVYSNTLV
jgi:hypothetical protein